LHLVFVALTLLKTGALSGPKSSVFCQFTFGESLN
jgi:hypothetical protein